MSWNKPSWPAFCGYLVGKTNGRLGASTSLPDWDSARAVDFHETHPSLDSQLPLVTQIPVKEAFVTTQEVPVQGWSEGGP